MCFHCYGTYWITAFVILLFQLLQKQGVLLWRFRFAGSSKKLICNFLSLILVCLGLMESLVSLSIFCPLPTFLCLPFTPSASLVPITSPVYFPTPHTSLMCVQEDMAQESHVIQMVVPGNLQRYSGAPITHILQGIVCCSHCKII